MTIRIDPSKPPAISSSGRLFMPIPMGRMSAAIVDRIRSLIYSGDLVAGQGLPSERELCVLFEVSRVTVREALRMLEATGLVQIRVGAGGGAFVTAPTSAKVGEGITEMLALSTITATEVTEVRQLLDGGTVALACERATDDDIADLLAICDAADLARSHNTYDPATSAEFHIRLARSTHNRALAMLVESLRVPLLMSLEQARLTDPVMGNRGNDEHRALVEAIRARDVAGAQEVMAAHLDRTLRRIAT
ncbi:FadR/GntR family transcriptional regulator [Glaciihabitans sp. UYNi722]|uniref:FadR/GntR family transcriptional regulator n=1 Tax=Glaciihabitans sp. UYNi722 TaxID=3156344 RepID=UPI003392F808